MRIVALTLSVFLLAAATAAFAQTTGSTIPPVMVGTGDTGDTYRPYPYSSTAGEGALRGMAEVIRSQAEFSVAASQVDVNRRLAQLYKNQAAMQYLQLRKVNNEYRAATHPPLSRGTIASIAQSYLPRRLTTGELNPVTGQIAWPSLLMESEFAGNRDQLDRLFAQRALRVNLSAGEYMTLDESVDQMQQQLSQRIQQYPADLYIAASRFLRGLNYEAKLVPVESVARISAVQR